MSGLVRWPEELPLPQLKGHGISQGNNILASKMSSGHVRTRRQFKNVPGEMPARFVFNSDQAQLFDAWFYHSINSGADWFLMLVKVPQGVIEHEVKFKPPPKAMKAISSTVWQKDAVLYIKQPSVISEQAMAEVLTAPDGFEQFVTDVEEQLPILKS